jgi:hypothetical protein
MQSSNIGVLSGESALRAVFITSAFAMLSATALSAFGQEPASDTLQAITTKGMVLTVSGFDIDMSFSADNRFTGMEGALTGKWRADGKLLCTTGDSDGVESCIEFPLGKKSGDAFPVTNSQGMPFDVRIK